MSGVMSGVGNAMQDELARTTEMNIHITHLDATQKLIVDRTETFTLKRWLNIQVSW